MKMRNKGKIHPLISSSSSSSSSPTQNNDVVFPVLNLLPAAIFSLISLLSIEDREVLAYMVSRSLKSANPPTDYKKKKRSKDCQSHDLKSPALFECECFHCYTSFWFRWDSSPNRELIHQAIEAFEEHLNSGEPQSRKSGNSKSKKREKMSRRRSDNGGVGGGGDVIVSPPVESPEKLECPVTVTAPEGDVYGDSGGGEVEQVDDVSTVEAEELLVAVEGHRGLARKVLPDVMGIFNSRLWRLWSPNA